MTSTMSGLYIAQSSLALNQYVINLINNNISNMNTPGYSKQRAELEQLTSGHFSSNPLENTYMGANISEISRNRDAYLDNYYRQEVSNYAYYNELSENAELIEDITNELDNTGINSSLNEFYEALSQFSSNPTDIVTRNTVVQKAMDLTTRLNSAYNNLNDLRVNLVGDFSDPNTLPNSKINSSISELNDKLETIAELNNAIVLSSSQGNSPNHLLDQRDMLLDELAELIPIEISPQTNGAVNIKIGSTNLVSGNEQVGFFDVTSGTIDEPAIVQIKNATGGTYVSDAKSMITGGKIGAILEMGGTDANVLTIKSVMDNLDTFAQEFALAFNAIQTAGQIIDSTVDPHVLTLDGDPTTAGVDPIPSFFVDDAAAGTTAGITAGNICINDAIVNDPYKIAAADAASDPEETGDGSNALSMFQLKDSIIAGLGSASTQQYISNMVGEIGSKTATIVNNMSIKEYATEQLSLKREAVMGVNLDEEMSDLIRFQRSYEASARVFSIVDSNIKTIINMVG